MFKTLYGKLAAILLGLFVIIGMLHVVLTFYTTQMYLQEVHQKLSRDLARNLVSENVLMHDGQVNETALKEIFHTLMVINPSIEVYLLDSGGGILAFSAPPGKVKRQRVSLQPITRFLSAETAFPILGQDPRGARREKVFSAAPIPLDGAPQGYLYVILGGEEFDSVVHMLQGSYILRLSLALAAGGLIVALVAGLFLFNRLTRRLRRLALRMETFRHNAFRQAPTPFAQHHAPSSDEVGEVETTFQQMADRIMAQMQALRQTDELRRRLIANVSHDLRTPLASLNGYLETLLLKKDRLSGEDQQQYLAIAARHGERLGKLVSELFELSKLDSQEGRPHAEPFSLGELVQDVVQKFHLAAEKKHIRLHTALPEDLPFVHADIGMIERVFENLIENALRYTPERGTVRVELTPAQQHIHVQVADTGCGIPQDELPYIFERFFRTSEQKAQGKSDGVGLGLAIAKRILELHQSPLQVSSAPGAGTTFSFHLSTHPVHL